MKRSLILTALLLVLLTGSALADRQATPQRLSDADLQQLFPSTRQDCVVGNLNAPYWVYNGWLEGEESYKYLYRAPEDCSCPLGYTVTSIAMALRFETSAMYPIVLELQVDLEEPLWNEDLSCWLPGPEICISDPVTVTIDGPGLFLVPVPIDCDCVFKNFDYFLSMHFLNIVPFNDVDLLLDEFPSLCTSYNDYGFGWVDLYFDFDFPGNLIMRADVDCCEPPVGNEEDTWGSVKSLYR